MESSVCGRSTSSSIYSSQVLQRQDTKGYCWGFISSKGNIWIQPEPLYHFTEQI